MVQGVERTMDLNFTGVEWGSQYVAQAGFEPRDSPSASKVSVLWVQVTLPRFRFEF